MQPSSGSIRNHNLTPMQYSYRKALHTMQAANIPFTVGGSHSLHHYTGIHRQTKDLDLFVLPADYARGLDALEAAGYQTILTYPHWLAKAFDGECLIDIIFNSGNAIGREDRGWFQHAKKGEMIGVPVKFNPVEEMIWTKGFAMERERFDGADIMRLMLARGALMDWARMLDRFGAHWRLLLGFVTLFGFVYPSRRSIIPR